MKASRRYKRIALIVLAVLAALCVTGCESSRKEQKEQYASVPPVGSVPENFQKLLELNLLADSHLSHDGFYTRAFREGDLYPIHKYDYFGNKLLDLLCTSPIADTRANIRQIASTKDGGTVLVYHLWERYDVDLDAWQKERSVAVKYDGEGSLLWQYEFADPVLRSENVFEQDGYYYFFGDCETVLMRTTAPRGDFCAYRISEDGGSVSFKTYGGSDYDTFHHAIQEEDGFRLYGSVSSKDGDFPAPEDRYGMFISALVDRELNLLSWRQEADWPSMYQTPDGPALLGLPLHDFLYDASLGSLRCVIDYGDFYLTVSTNITGIDYESMEKHPYRSMIPYFTETVYTACSYLDGSVIWRTAVSDPPWWNSN